MACKSQPAMSLVSSLFCWVLVSCPALVNAALHGRLPATPGGTDFQAFYDDQLDITWSAQIGARGLDTWTNQTQWASELNVDGVTGWRLPNVDVNNDGIIIHCVNEQGPVCLDNEYAYHFRVNGITPATPGPFAGFDQSGIYWSNSPQFSAPNAYWAVSVSVVRGIGGFTWYNETTMGLAWAVHDGDVTPPSVREMLLNLINKVIALNLKSGISNSLDSKLKAAYKALDQNNKKQTAHADNLLHAFIYNVEAQRGKHLTYEQADALTAEAERIIARYRSGL